MNGVKIGIIAIDEFSDVSRRVVNKMNRMIRYINLSDKYGYAIENRRGRNKLVKVRK